MNKYQILQTIGQGQYGVVLKARNKQTGDLVAIKKFKEDDSDEQNKRVILRQVKILKTLNNQNIIQLKQAFRKKCRIYLVCQFVDKNLLQLMQKGLITPSLLKNYAFQILKGISYMHSLNIIHRDIKPQNVLISNKDKVKICDLGFARNLPTNGKMTDYVATRWYRPPELILGRDDYQKSIDIWAVGCVIAEMINGQPLFGGENDLDQLYLIQKCLGPLTSQHQEYFIKNPKFIGMKFPQIHTLETIERRYLGKIDKLGIDLLKKMLKMQPSSRITAEQALNHPYFSRSSSQSEIQFRRNNLKESSIINNNNNMNNVSHYMSNTNNYMNPPNTNQQISLNTSNINSNPSKYHPQQQHLSINNFINNNVSNNTTNITSSQNNNNLSIDPSNVSSRQSKQQKTYLNQNKITNFSKLKNINNKLKFLNMMILV